MAENAERMAFATQIFCQHDLPRLGNKLLPIRDLERGVMFARLLSFFRRGEPVNSVNGDISFCVH
jgi:hypothetical protein